MVANNPFRAQPPPPSNNRRLWNFFFVTALGLSVLWLSWTLLLDDFNEDSIDVELEQEQKTPLIFEDDEQDAKVGRKDTKLRPRSQLFNEDQLAKRPVSLPHDDDDVEDELDDEKLAEQDIDDDTQMNDQSLDVTATKSRKPAPKQSGKPDSSTRTKKVEDTPMLHEEDDDAIDDEHIATDNDEEDAMEEEEQGLKFQTGGKQQKEIPAEGSPKHADPATRKKSSEVEKEEATDNPQASEGDDAEHDDMPPTEKQVKKTVQQAPKQQQPVQKTSSNAARPISEDDEDAESQSSPFAGEQDDFEAVAKQKQTKTTNADKMMPETERKTTKVEKKTVSAPSEDEDVTDDIPEEEESEQEDPPRKQHMQPKKPAKNEEADDEEEDADTNLPAEEGSKAKTVGKGAKVDEIEEEEDADADAGSTVAVIDESKTKGSGKVAKFDEAEEDDEESKEEDDEEAPAPLPIQEEEEEEDKTDEVDTVRKNDKKASHKRLDVEPAEETEDDEEAGAPLPIEDDDAETPDGDAESNSAKQKKEPDEDSMKDEDVEADDILRPHAPVDETESEEDELTPKPTLKQPIKTKESEASDARPLQTIVSKPSKELEDEEDESLGQSGEADDATEQIPRLKTLPSQISSAESAATTDEQPLTTGEQPVLACESIRKKTDCEVRDDCKWKYPKSETTGFFCVALEACTDVAMQRKPKCTALPKCDWVRISSNSYGCRDRPSSSGTELTASSEDSPVEAKSDVSEKAKESATTAKASTTEQSNPSATVNGCEAHVKKAKCLAEIGCSWIRTSTQPTTYGCREEEPPETVSVDANEEQIVDEEGYASASEIEDVEESDDQRENGIKTAPAGVKKSAQQQHLIPEVVTKKTEKAGVDVDETEPAGEQESLPPSPEKPGKRTSNSEMEGEETEARPETLEEEGETGENAEGEVAPGSNEEKAECSSIRVKSLCQFRTDCYWKYPASYSTGKYCVPRDLAIKVSPEKSTLYESIVAGTVSLVDPVFSEAFKNAAPANPKFKTLGTDWKRFKSDVSCSLHPECVSKENITADLFSGYSASLKPPATYVRAQCCTNHPPLRTMFFQLTDFLNREGIPWWFSAQDLASIIYSDGFLLPWTNQITLEMPIFGSKTAVDWASTHELRENLTSYSTTRSRVLRSTKNDFASRLLHFNSDPQHLPNTLRVCAGKFSLGSEKKSTSSYSSEWLRAEKSGDDQCLVVSKISKIPSSKTPLYFLVSHIDEIEGKGPSIKLVPRILRTASSDSCLQAWRPGSSFEPIPLHMVLPTVPCFGQGKFQGFTGVSRCPRDALAFFAWEGKGNVDESKVVNPVLKKDLAEFRKWTTIDYCSRGLLKQ